VERGFHSNTIEPTEFPSANARRRIQPCSRQASETPEPKADMNATLAPLVRRHDPDRFLTALFAPPEKRALLFVLFAFNHELARIREVASESTLVLIRLQWWREVIDGACRAHEVARPLAEALAMRRLWRQDLHAIIDAREIEAEPEIANLADWRAYMLAGAGGVAVAAARVLGAPEPELMRPAGAAYGVAGLLRSASLLAARGRCLLPADLLAREGASVERAVGEPASPQVQAVAAQLVSEARTWLLGWDAARVPREAIAAALPAVFARRDLARWPRLASFPRGIGDKLAVTIAGLRGRV
jgi:phytoene synthase